jgi:hypothetical protein
MRKLIIALAATMAIAGCTTTERDVAVGAGVGAAAGGLISGDVEGALVGAAVGAATGVLVRNLRNGFCEYRDSRGRIYTARCN